LSANPTNFKKYFNPKYVTIPDEKRDNTNRILMTVEIYSSPVSNTFQISISKYNEHKYKKIIVKNDSIPMKKIVITESILISELFIIKGTSLL
jgi:hypothetical protein